MLSFMVVVGNVTVPTFQLVTVHPFFSKKPPAHQDLSSSHGIQPVPNPSYSETFVTTSSDSSLKQ